MARSDWRCAVTSRSTSTAPSSPSPSRIGAAFTVTGCTVPSRARSAGSPPAAAAPRVASAVLSGLRNGAPLRSSKSWNSSFSGRPAASAARHAVRRCAAAFRKRTRPAASVATTPSPMLASVTCSHSRCSVAAPSACARCVAARSSVRATQMMSELNHAVITSVKSVMPNASPKTPSRSA